MHVVLGVLVAALVIYLIYRAVSAPGASSGEAAGARSDRGFAFVSNGLIFLRERGAEVKQVHSTYAQEAADRRERARERNSWKQGTSFRIAAGGGTRDFEPADKPVLATSAAFEANGNLLYFMEDDHIGGLFRRDAASGNELRVLLRQNLHLRDLAVSLDGAKIAASSTQSTGTANIALLEADGSKYREVTGGDSVDSAPAWIPGAPDRLLFQSAGMGRDQQGYIVAQGHSTLQMLDMQSGSVSPVLDDARFDHLKPRVAPSGDLLFIRRPYEAPRYGASNALVDTVLFPFRLLRAVFHYLNFFSLMYSRKPLTTANGPAMQADIKNILLQGRRIDAEKALRSAGLVQGVPSLVPASWQLVSRNQNGDERVLATHVASFDIGADGAIVYSNGRGVFVLEKDGSSRVAATQDLVGEVIATAV